LRLNEEQRKLLMDQLAALRDRSKALEAQLSDQTERTTLAQKDIDQRDIRIKALQATLESAQAALTGEQQTSGRDAQQIAALTAEIQALREQLARLATALDAAEAKNGSQKTAIDDLTGRLNAALANKVEELARYRSEFFGRLREVIGTRPDIRIVGDRFVFQSEVLFPTGSATLQDAGKVQLAQLAHALLDIARTIPPDVNWILRVDGHTDPRRIATYQFPSNWELSTAGPSRWSSSWSTRAFPRSGWPATGFGEFQPLVSGDNDEAFARNRRIELKLDQR
jgi:chemotaxis protein MotB